MDILENSAPHRKVIGYVAKGLTLTAQSSMGRPSNPPWVGPLPAGIYPQLGEFYSKTTLELVYAKEGPKNN